MFLTMYTIYLTNKFHFCMRLYCNRLQLTSWRVRIKKVLHGSSAVTFFSSHAKMSSMPTTVLTNKKEIYLLRTIKQAYLNENPHPKKPNIFSSTSLNLMTSTVRVYYNDALISANENA